MQSALRVDRIVFVAAGIADTTADIPGDSVSVEATASVSGDI